MFSTARTTTMEYNTRGLSQKARKPFCFSFLRVIVLFLVHIKSTSQSIDQHQTVYPPMLGTVVWNVCAKNDTGV